MLTIENVTKDEGDSNYKGTQITKRAYAGEREHCITVNGHEMVVMQLRDGKWWIIPATPQHDDIITPHGPFDTPEVAWSTLQLLKD